MDKKKKESKKTKDNASKKKVNSWRDGEKALRIRDMYHIIPDTWREGNGNLITGTKRINDDEDVISEIHKRLDIPSEWKGDGKLQTGVCRKPLFDYGGPNHERKGKNTKKEGERDA